MSKPLPYLCMEVMQPRRGVISVPCPLPGSSGRSGRSPHATLGQAARPPATPSQLHSRDRWGRKPPPPFCKQPDRQESLHELTPRPAMALPGYPHSSGVQRKNPPGSAPCTPSLLCLATAIPYSHHSMRATSFGPEQQKTAASPSSKIPCHFFPLTPPVIY